MSHDQRDTLNGWRILSDEENIRLWDRFDARFKFKPSVRPEEWPSIVEPTPSVTWKVPQIFTMYVGDRTRFDSVERELERAVSKLLITGMGERCEIFSLSLQKVGYAFVPDVHAVAEWERSVAPIGNYRVFAPENLECGLFGHPWEQTICIFGSEMFNPVTRELEDVLRTIGNPIRSHGARQKM